MLREPRPEAEVRNFEGALLDIARALPVEFDVGTGAGFAALQARRAISIHRGLLNLIDGPSLPSLFVLARPLVEIAVVTSWVLLDAEQRIVRWSAEQQRRDLQLIEDMRALGRSAVDWASGDVRRIEDEKRAGIAEVRARFSLPESKPLVPNLFDMAQEVGTGEAIEAYKMGYRSLSPWTHSNEGAFRFNFIENAYVPDGPPGDNPRAAQLARLMAISLTAWILEQTGIASGNRDLAIAARAVIEESLAAGQIPD